VTPAARLVLPPHHHLLLILLLYLLLLLLILLLLLWRWLEHAHSQQAPSMLSVEDSL
jgi:polyferredoxin